MSGRALLFALIVVAVSVMHQFLVNYPIYYIVIFKILTDHEHRHIQMLTKSVKNDVRDINKLLEERDLMNSLKHEFERLFNFIPYVLFGGLFASIPATFLSLFQGVEDKKSYAIQELVLFLSVHVFIFILLFCLVQNVSQAQDSVQEAISGLIRVIQRRNICRLQETGYHTLIEDLRMNEKFVFTGWFLFTINRYAFLSFISAVISFSVLLIQIGRNVV